jgi:hypothetical protein
MMPDRPDRPDGWIFLSYHQISQIHKSNQMIKDAEKRRDRRHDCDARIKWTQFNRTTFDYGQEIFYQARVLNFSKSGLYFEIGCHLKPGSTILFRIETPGCVAFDEEGCQSLRTISLVETKWCQDILKNGESYFGIGARYPIPY